MGNKNFAVGLFVSVALLIFFTATIWLTGKQGTEPTTDYSMYFESDVGGLMLGGPVFFLGVKVGTVTSMTIIPGNPMRIRVDARILKKTPINKGTYATLAMQGVTGVAVVKLKADSGEFGPLVAVKGEPNLTIETRDSGFNALLQKAPDIIDKLDDVLVHLNELLGPGNRDNISQVLADFATLTGALASKKESIEQLPDSLNGAIADLRKGLGEARAMMADVKPQLGSSMDNLSKATQDLAELSGRLEAWANNYNDEVDVIMEDGLGQVPMLVSEARIAIREMKKLLQELRDNPSLLIYKPNEDSIDVKK